MIERKQKKEYSGIEEIDNKYTPLGLARAVTKEFHRAGLNRSWEFCFNEAKNTFEWKTIEKANK